MSATDLPNRRKRWMDSGLKWLLVIALSFGLIGGTVFAWMMSGHGRPADAGLDENPEINQYLKKASEISGVQIQASARGAALTAQNVPDPGAVAITNQMLPMVEAADPKATSYMLRLATLCGGFSTFSAQRAKAPSGATAEVRQLQDKAFKRVQALCSDPRIRDPEIRELLVVTHDTLAEFGDDLATVERLGKGGWGGSREEQVKKTWDLAANSDKREVRLSAINTLIERGMVTEFEKVFSTETQPWNPHLGGYRGAAAAMVSCEIEGDCGPYTLFQEQRCLENGECASDLDIRTFVRTVAFSDSERDALLHYIDAITEQLKSSKARRGS